MLAFIGNNRLININAIDSVYLQQQIEEWQVILRRRNSHDNYVLETLANFNDEHEALTHLEKILTELRNANCLVNLAP